MYVSLYLMRTLLLGILLFTLHSASAQIYVLKDHRDSFVPNMVYDSLPLLCDSFYSNLRFDDPLIMRLFSPTVEYLKLQFDSSAADLKESDYAVKQQQIELRLRKAYKKAIKQSHKDKVKFKHFELNSKEYTYGSAENGNEFCYVTLVGKKKKKELRIRFLATKIEDAWFIVDELYFSWD